MPINFENGTAPATPASGLVALYSKTDKNLYIKDDAGTEKQVTVAGSSTLYHATCHGRLTLTSGTAITTSDVTAATSVYFTPYNGDQIGIYDGATTWAIYTFTERPLSLSGLTTTQPYDIFIYNNGGTLTLEALAWTSNTARATALTAVNGVWCKSGATSRRYLGTIKMQATGQAEDSLLRRFLWNNHNRVERRLKVTDSTDSWTYGTAAWRSLNNSTANRVEFVLGWSEDLVHLWHHMAVITQTTYTGIALDGTAANDCDLKAFAQSSGAIAVAMYQKHVAIGYHYLQLTEYAAAATATIYGDAGAPTLFQMGGEGWVRG